MNIVFLDAGTLGADIKLDKFSRLGDVTIHTETKSGDVLARSLAASVLVVNKIQITSDLMEKLPQLKLICVAATGTDNIDLKAAEKFGVQVKNVKGYSTESVVQHTFSMLFYLLEDLNYYDRFTSENKWEKLNTFSGYKSFQEVSNKSWGIIGLGAIGLRVANVAQCFGANIQYYSTSGKNTSDAFKQVELHTLLSTSDIITIHAPLNELTKNLINKDNLTLLKANAILLNLGRGGIINENDLFEFLKTHSNKVGLDVAESEPPKHDSSFSELARLSNTFITPHIAWASLESRERLAEKIFQNILQFKG